MSADEFSRSALAEKEAGNVAYKSRQFAEARKHYEAAWELHKDITFLNNLAAAFFEEENYDSCIETCQKAVDEGRDMRADYKLIAKAFGRIGSAYAKKLDWNNAIKFYNKSLTEHRTPDILQKLKDSEKAKVEADKSAYVDPALAEKARNEGNALFKAGDFAGSVKLYEEAIKRDPDDARGYTNRAAAYIKLLALSEALKDSEMSIKVNPKFVKGYIRKANAKFAMKEYDAAIEACAQAREIDTEKKNTTEISQQERKCMEAKFQQQASETDEERLARAAKDPEVQSILSDPVMQQILQQAQQDPKALMSHMQNPEFRRKIEKLSNAGVIKLGTR